MKKINLFGAGGHGKVIKEIVESEGYRVECFYDDNPDIAEHCGVAVCKVADSAVEGGLIVCIGDNRKRKSVVDRIDVDYATAVHPSAILSPTVKLSAGSVVMQRAVIQADAYIGKHSIINTSASVDHDCRIGDFVHISPGATLCGAVSIGDGTLIGTGSVVVPGVKIGKWCIIGAGSVVLTDIPDGVVAYGNPCKVHSSI